jgi:hypothetical protein
MLVKIGVPLTVLFVILKLTGNIDWSWWLVMAPIYPTLFVLTVVYALVFIWNRHVVRMDRWWRNQGRGPY